MATVDEIFQQARRQQTLGNLAEAVRLYQQVVRHDARRAEAWHQLGCLAFHINQHEVAFENFRRAILLDGQQARYHHNMGACCRALSKLPEAQASYEQAVRLDPEFHIARVHLCFTRFARGLRDEAERCSVDTLRRERRSAEAHWACGSLLLFRGDFANGWPEHEWRWKIASGSNPAALERPRWDGRPLAGQTVLMVAEQGLGDTLQFARYAPLVAARGGDPVLAVQRSLLPLLGEADLCACATDDRRADAGDLQAAMFSLPAVLGTTLDSVPADIPYLRANPRLVTQWAERLGGLRGVRVGIHWQGNPAFNFDRTRSIPLSEFAAVARVPGVNLVSLQKGAGREQLSGLAGSFPVLDLSDELDVSAGPFMDTAAVMKNLDLVVTSDTATAHLAGALGVPVWVALSAMPDWRWMVDRQDSPWYPTMRLFRQSRLGEWSDVFARIAGELAEMAGRDRQTRAPHRA